MNQVNKAQWGIKHLCQNCETRFYDMKKSPPMCPKCGIAAEVEKKPKPRRGIKAAPPIAEPIVAKAPVPANDEDEDDIDLDVEVPDLEIDDDEDDDDDLIEDPSTLGDDDDDVTEVIVHISSKDDKD